MRTSISNLRNNANQGTTDNCDCTFVTADTSHYMPVVQTSSAKIPSDRHMLSNLTFLISLIFSHDLVEIHFLIHLDTLDCEFFYLFYAAGSQ